MIFPEGAPVLTAAAMRAAEDAAMAAGTAQQTLMERAGTAIAREAARFAMGRPVLVLAGPGNNGGDAYVAARLLHAADLDVAVAALGQARDGPAADMRARWTGPTVALDAADSRPVLVDGLFGTGMRRPLEPGVRAALARLVAGAEFTLAIDLVSGLATDCGGDLGAPAGVDVTVALGALKPAHVLGDGLARSGHVLIADIGVPVPSNWRTVARPRLVPPAPDAHKYTRGLVVVVEGAMPGAARLAARAAMHAGAGYVILAGAGPGDGGPDALVRHPIGGAGALGRLLADPRVGAVVIGPGLGRDARARDWLAQALASDRPLVIDGDALSLLADSGPAALRRAAPVWLTPHGGEFARLFAARDSKIAGTCIAATQTGAVVVHKGADTVIADSHGAVRILAGASSWLASAGTGDVLAGMIGARVAMGDAGIAAVEAAAWLHARAAQLAGPALIADTLADRIPEAVGECL